MHLKQAQISLGNVKWCAVFLVLFINRLKTLHSPCPFFFFFLNKPEMAKVEDVTLIVSSVYVLHVDIPFTV